MYNTNGVYITYSGNTGGNFLGSIVDKIRNINAICKIDERTGHAHYGPTRWDGISLSNPAELISPQNFKLIPLEFDPYIILTHENISNIKSIFTYTKFIRIFVEENDYRFIAKNLYAKQFIELYQHMSPETYHPELYNKNWKTFPHVEIMEKLYKKFLSELNFKTTIDPQSVNIETYNKFLDLIIEHLKKAIVNDNYFGPLDDSKNLLQIRCIDLVNRNYSVIDNISNFLDKPLTTRHRQLVCDLMDEYANNQPSYERMKFIYNFKKMIGRYNVSVQRHS
jgi:hypothetical protein